MLKRVVLLNIFLLFFVEKIIFKVQKYSIYLKYIF